MENKPDPRFGIPLERTVQPRRPGRWMAVVWLLFAVALTVGIIAIVQNVVPIAEGDRENASIEEVELTGETVAAPAPPSDSALAPTAEETVAPLIAEAPGAAPAPPGPAPVAPPPRRMPVEGNAGDAWAPGASARLVEKAEAVQREGGRVKGYLTLRPGTEIEIQEVLPDGRYRVRWREASAEVPASALAPVAP